MTDSERQLLMNIQGHIDLARQQMSAADKQLKLAESKLAGLLQPPKEKQ